MMEKRSRFAVWGLRVGMLALAVLILSVAANHLGIIGYSLPVAGIALGALLGLIAIVVSLIGLVAVLGGKAGAGAAIMGIVLGALAVAPVASAKILGQGVPRIHDITTDLANPPQFDAVVALRKGAPNALDRKSPPDLAAEQQKAYPDLTTLVVQEQPGKVFEAALETAKAMGWQIDASTPENGLIEATDVTKLIGFKDDVAIRIEERDGGTAVDVRSVSRVGVSDLGTNAKRIRAYLAALQSKLATPAS